MEKKYIINNGEDGIFDTLEEAVMAWVDFIGGTLDEIEIYEAEIEYYTIEKVLGEMIGLSVLNDLEESISENMHADFDDEVFRKLSPDKLAEFHEFIYKFIQENSNIFSHYMIEQGKKVNITREMLIDIFGEDDFNEMVLSEQDL